MTKRLARLLLLITLSAIIAFSFTGCASFGGSDAEPAVTMPPLTAELFTDYDAVYTYYGTVTFDDTLTSITERLGEPVLEETENGPNYTWIFDDGYGVVCTFYNTGELRAKVVYFEDLRQFRELSHAQNLSTVESFDTDIDFQTCVNVFVGRPIEIAQIAPEAANDGISRVYSWIDANDGIVQILFKSTGKVESITYNKAQ